MLGLGSIGQFAIGEQSLATVSAETITVDKWYQPLSEPRRFQRGLGYQYQQFLTLNPFPAISLPWFTWLSEPVRQKRGLRAQFHTFATKANINPLVPFNWFSLLSEPKRFKPRLLESEQVFTHVDLLPTILMDWFASLSEPKRFKSGLRPDEQVFLARGEFVPTTYTASLDATELGDFFLGVLTQFNIPLSAYVDIIQNDPRHRGNLGVIAQAPQSSTIAAIIEPDPVQAASVISPVPAVGARVAIIVQ